MALEVIQLTATIPAGTPKTLPLTVPLPLDNREVEALDLEVPPGPSGLMGFYVANNDEQWVPRPAGEWLVWDDVRATWGLTGQPNASGWQIVGYNEDDFYDHSIVARFHVTLPAQPSFTLQPITFTATPIEPEAVVS